MARAPSTSSEVSDPRERGLEMVGGIWLVIAAFVFKGNAFAQALTGALGVMTVASSAWLWHRVPDRRFDPTLLIGIAALVAAFLSISVVALFVSNFFVGTMLVLSSVHARVTESELPRRMIRR